MSRIHEALKKAEQERATTQGGTVSGFPTPEAPEIATVSPGPLPVTPAFSGALNSDTLLSRCAQVPWQADTTTMLFLNGNDQAPGTEEYRTLRSRLYHLREKIGRASCRERVCLAV